MTDDTTAKTSGRDLLRGVFTSEVTISEGQGAAMRQITETVHYYAEELKDGQVAMTPLNANFVPSGEPAHISMADLLADYAPDPETYYLKVRPALAVLDETIATAERHRRHNRTYSAEYEFKNALRVDEENIRATFGLGLTYLDRMDKDKAEVVFRRIVRLREAFEPRHKHLFNEFGIQLRKNGMFIPALKYYARAYHLCRDDEHLVYNIARVYYERGMDAKAGHFLRKALQINPDFKDGQEFLTFLSQDEHQDALLTLQSYDGKARKKRKRVKISPEFRIRMGKGAASPGPDDDGFDIGVLEGAADVQVAAAPEAVEPVADGKKKARVIANPNAGEFSFRFVKPVEDAEKARKIKVDGKNRE